MAVSSVSVPPAASGGRFRGLTARLLSAIVLGPLVLAAIWYGFPWIDLVAAIAAPVMVSEWIGLTRGRPLRRLLGIAYSPQYRDNGLVFVDYTDAAGDTQIVRFRRGKYGHFLKGSATTILSVRQPYANHNGGQLAFGPDGLLYIAVAAPGASLPADTPGKIIRLLPQ